MSCRVVVLSIAVLALAVAASAQVQHVPECRITCLDEGDDGDTVHLRVGEFVHVLLGGNPSTGFDWLLEGLDQDVVRSLSRSFTPDRPDLLGSVGVYRWFFMSETRGEMDLVLAYYRPWEGPGSAETTVTVHLVVHGHGTPHVVGRPGATDGQ